MKKAKTNQSRRHSLRQVEPTGARSTRSRAATPPPRSRRGPPPKTAASLAAAGLTEIVPPVRPDGEEKKFGLGPGNKGAGAGQGVSATVGPGPNGRGVEGLLAERERTHGRFEETSSVANSIRRMLRTGRAFAWLGAGQCVALDEIALKLARIVCGDPSHRDHWDDVSGYAIKGRDA